MIRLGHERRRDHAAAATFCRVPRSGLEEGSRPR